MMDTINAQPLTNTAIAVRSESSITAWTPSFVVGIEEAVARVAAKHEFFLRVMRDGDHYGVIPGTKTKPTLLKPGAELLLASMGLHAEFSDEDEPDLDLTGVAHGGEAYIRFRRRCAIYRQTGEMEAERMLVARASGSCSSWETKYRYRDSQRRCPACGAEAIIKGKAEFGGGWLCFAKKGGCGAKFGDADQAIVGQTIGRIPNPDVADLENTILKMSDKRALVAATLIATGCSDIFTQDLEDAVEAVVTTKQSAKEAPAVAIPSSAAIRARYEKLRALDASVPADVRDWAEENVPEFDRAHTTGRALIAIDVALLAAIDEAQKPHDEVTPDVPMTEQTRKHLMASLNEIGVRTKEERLAYAAAYGFTVESYSELGERIARELWAQAIKLKRCPACNASATEPHLTGCPEVPA